MRRGMAQRRQRASEFRTLTVTVLGPEPPRRRIGLGAPLGR